MVKRFIKDSYTIIIKKDTVIGYFDSFIIPQNITKYYKSEVHV